VVAGTEGPKVYLREMFMGSALQSFEMAESSEAQITGLLHVWPKGTTITTQTHQQTRTSEASQAVGAASLASSVAASLGSKTTALVAATNRGALRVFPYPMAATDTFDEYPLHLGQVTMMCLSADKKTLVTAGEDGAIFVLRLRGDGVVRPRGIQGGSGQATEEQQGNKDLGQDRDELSAGAVESQLAEVVLVHRQEILGLQQKTVVLANENAHLAKDFAYKLEAVERDCHKKANLDRMKDTEDLLAANKRQATA
jgi:hypothetical protein